MNLWSLLQCRRRQDGTGPATQHIAFTAKHHKTVWYSPWLHRQVRLQVAEQRAGVYPAADVANDICYLS